VHFQYVIPRFGRLVSGHASAYRYPPVSVDHFLTPDELASRLRMAGFDVRGVRTFHVRDGGVARRGEAE
jgi:ubiquinone/menaquinone biosynthesis C-methylase UbiE